MRNVVLIMTASIDGYVAPPTGHAGGRPEPYGLHAPHLSLLATTTYSSGTMLNICEPLGWGQVESP
jgi:hypothetical protein